MDSMKPLVDLMREEAHFKYFRGAALYYETDSGFTFSVPVAEVEGATLKGRERAMVFMRWIRPQYQACVGELATSARSSVDRVAVS